MGCANAKAAKLDDIETLSKADLQHVEKGRDGHVSAKQQLGELAEEEKVKELAAARIQASQRGQSARRNSPVSIKAEQASVDSKGTVSLEPCVTVAQARLSFSAEDTPPSSPVRVSTTATSKTQASASPSCTGTQPSVPASPMLLPTGQATSPQRSASTGVVDGEDGVGHAPPEEPPSMPAALLQSNATSPNREKIAFPSLVVDGTAPTDLTHRVVTPVKMIAHFDPSVDVQRKDEKAKDNTRAAQKRAKVPTKLGHAKPQVDEATTLASAVTGRVLKAALAHQSDPVESSPKRGADAEDEAAQITVAGGALQAAEGTVTQAGSKWEPQDQGWQRWSRQGWEAQDQE